jgi:hypothetical protein
MSTMSLTLPESLDKQVCELAQTEGDSLGEWRHLRLSRVCR